MKKALLAFLILFRLFQPQAQIDDDFYGMYNLHFVAQPLRPSFGIQVFDWTVAEPGRFGMFIDAKVRLLSDVLNLKRAPYSNNEPNFIGGWLEMRCGFNVVSRDKFNTAIGVSPFNIWSVISSKGNNSRAVIVSGVFIKHDHLISEKYMLRTFLSPDFFLLKSSNSNLENYRINLMSFELIHKSGLYGGIDFLNARYSGISNTPGDLTSRRLEFKLGVKLIK